MHRRRSRLVAAAATALLIAGCAERTDRRPNIVIVVSDSLRAANLSLYGYERATTPVLEGLARESIVFEQHFANYPSTPFSVSQLLSGRLMSPLLMEFEPNRVPVRELDAGLLILPRELRAGGYATGLVSSHPWFGPAARVREFFDFAAVELSTHNAYAPFAELLPAIARFLDEAKGAGRPFFLYVHSMDTHTPMRFHEGFDAHRDDPSRPRDINAYDSEIQYTDHHLGLVLEELRRRDQLDDTLFAFTSDHGEEFGEAGSAWWLRGHGATLRRPLLHVPLLVRFPGAAQRGRRAAVSRHVDLAPTLLRWIDADFELDAFSIDGRDLSDELAGAARPQEGASVSYNWSFWALHDAAHEIYYDQWAQGFEAYRVTRGPDGRPVREADPAASEGGPQRAALLRRMLASAAEMEKAPRAATPTDELLIGLPTFVDHSRGAAPSLRALPGDDRWLLRSPSLLEARAGERPEPIVLGMPWIPGRYEVAVRLAQKQARAGYANRVRIEFLGADNEPVAVDGRDAESPFLVPLGVQTLSRSLAVRISDPQGDVAIAGFWLRPVGVQPATAAPLTPELERQLRDLGYVE